MTEDQKNKQNSSKAGNQTSAQEDSKRNSTVETDKKDSSTERKAEAVSSNLTAEDSKTHPGTGQGMEKDSSKEPEGVKAESLAKNQMEDKQPEKAKAKLSDKKRFGLFSLFKKPKKKKDEDQKVAKVDSTESKSESSSEGQQAGPQEMKRTPEEPKASQKADKSDLALKSEGEKTKPSDGIQQKEKELKVSRQAASVKKPEEVEAKSSVKTQKEDKESRTESLSESRQTDQKEIKAALEEPEVSQKADKLDLALKQEEEKAESSAEDQQEAKALKAESASESQKAGQQEMQTAPEEPKADLVKLEGLFAFKMSMTTFYNDKGESVPVTALKYEPCRVSQIKTQEKESYQAVQVAFKAQKNKRCSKALIGHLISSGFKEGARFVREIHQKISEEIKPGQEVSIESLKKGDMVKITSLSKGRGFAGVMKRWNFAGGKATHGSKSHRRIGSIGQHTEPARVMPGRKMPGQYGFRQVSRLKVPVVDVLPEEGMIFVKGPVPGARNTLVSLVKMSNPAS